MARSIFYKCTKKQIEDATNKILNILKSGQKDSLREETKDAEEREKNKKFKADYDINDEYKKELLIDNLKKEKIFDVKLDERPEKLRNGNEMYIYYLVLDLLVDNREIKVDTYVKIEMVQIKGNKKIVLLISFHEPEYEMYERFNELND